MNHDFVKPKLPKELSWGQNIDFTLDFPEHAKGVIVMLKRIQDKDIDNSTGKIKNESQARANATIITLDYATPQDRVIDLSMIPSEARGVFREGIYFLDYAIDFKDGRFRSGSRLYRNLQKAP